MRDWLGALVVTAAAAALLSACDGPPTGGNGPTAASTTQAGPRMPPRPKDVDLTGVDACTLLTLAQQQQLGTDSPPEFNEYPDEYGNRRCDYSRAYSSPYFGYQLKVVTQEDATVYLTGERDSVSRVVSAAGFPAVEGRLPGDGRGCFTFVSTKDGQYLSVQYGQSTGSNDPPDVMCEKSRVAAELAMQTLLTQR